MSLRSDRIFEELGPEKEIALEFFATFSRFEHALKHSGLCRNENDGENAKASWDKYARRLHQEVKRRIEEEANHYLLVQPPKIQIMKSGKVGWKAAERSGSDTTRWIFNLINIVRNNLFHGGKYRDPEDGEDNPDPEREKKLVEACLSILNICLETEDNVTEAFYSGLGMGRYGPDRLNPAR